jgi:uncharacterized iron-regulated protein
MHRAGNHASGSLSGFIQAQSLWDETMAAAIAEYLHNHPNMMMIVLAGNQHTRKDSGIPPRVARRIDVPQATIANLATSRLSGRALRQTADYLFLLEAEDFEPQGKIGVVLEEKGADGETVMQVVGLTPDSNAAAAGIRKNDYLIGIDGDKITTMNEVRAAMLDRLAGETAVIEVRRVDDDGREASHRIEVVLFGPHAAGVHP